MTSNQNKAERIFNIPPLVQVLILINLVVFVLIQYLPEEVFLKLTFVPTRYQHFADLTPTAITAIFTHQFMHADRTHLFMNLAALLAFGSGIEKNFGDLRTLFIYVLSGIAAVFTHSLFYPDSTVPMLGASGAISGMLGFIIFMMSGRRSKGMIAVIVVWLLFNFLVGSMGMPGSGNTIAWEAHMGGFIMGILLAVTHRRYVLRR